MAMDEEEQDHQKSAENSMLDITSENDPCEVFDSTHTSVIEMCVTPSCDRFGKIFQAEENVEGEQTCVTVVSKCDTEAREAEGIENGLFSSSSASDHSGSDEESDKRLIPPQESFVCTPLSSNKKCIQSKRSAEKDFRIYNPQHDFFADCPELNKADGFLKWENIETRNCESSCTPVSRLSRSTNKGGCVDNFVTPKRIITTPKRSNSRTAKKHCKRNLKVTELVEGNTGNITNTETLCMLMQGQRVVKDLWKRNENAKSKKRLRQRNGSPMGCVNISPGVTGISPLPHTPVRQRLQGEDNILSTQPTTPILDSYEKESNVEDIDPTQPSSMLVLQDVVAYVEVRSGGDNRSMGVKDQLRRLGAIIVDTFSDEVTHVIFKDGLPSTYSRALKRGVPVVSVLWIEACKRAGLRVSERMYPIEEEFTKKIVKPQKKFRKMKSIQPDYDGKVERKKKRGKKDANNIGEEDNNFSDEPATTPKMKSTKLTSISEGVSPTDCHNPYKQGVLLSDVSTDSDCSPDNLRVHKKKVAKKKSVPPVPKWARKSFCGNPVAETLVGVAKIRKKDVEETVSECPPPVETPTGTHESPLAMRLLQIISSPASDAQATSNTHVDLHNITKVETASEKYVTPIKTQDKTKEGKIIGKEKTDIRKWARISICGNADTVVGAADICKKNEETVNESKTHTETPTHTHDSPLALRLLHKVSSPASDPKACSSSHVDRHDITEAEIAPEKYVTPIKNQEKTKKRKNIADIRKWTRKPFIVNSDANKSTGAAKISENDEKTVSEPQSTVEASKHSCKSPWAMQLVQKNLSPASNKHICGTSLEIASDKCLTPIKSDKTKRMKITDRKNIIPEWARKAFGVNPVGDTVIGAANICEKDKEIVLQPTSLVETPAHPCQSPLASHIVQKTFSPSFNTQVCGTSVETESEKYLTPIKSDKTKRMKIIDGKNSIPEWARKKFSQDSVGEALVGGAKICEKDKEIVPQPKSLVETPAHSCHSPLAGHLVQKTFSPSSNTQVCETSVETESDKYLTPIKSDKTNRMKITDGKNSIPECARKKFSEDPVGEALVSGAKICEKDKEIVLERTSLVETPAHPCLSPLASHLVQKAFSPPSNTQVCGTSVETGSDKYLTPIKSDKTKRMKITDGKNSIPEWARKKFCEDPVGKALVGGAKICEKDKEIVPEPTPLVETPAHLCQSPQASHLVQKNFSPSSNTQVCGTSVEIESVKYLTPIISDKNKRMKITDGKNSIPEWARKIFSEDPVGETLVGADMICGKNKETLSGPTPTCPQGSPLAMRLIQKISSPTSGPQGCNTSHGDLHDINKVDVSSEKCVTPMKNQDKTKQGVVTVEEKEGTGEAPDGDCINTSEDVICEATCSSTVKKTEFCKLIPNSPHNSAEIGKRNLENRISSENADKETSITNQAENNHCNPLSCTENDTKEQNLVEVGSADKYLQGSININSLETGSCQNVHNRQGQIFDAVSQRCTVNIRNHVTSAEKSVACEDVINSYSPRPLSLNVGSKTASDEPSSTGCETVSTEERIPVSKTETSVVETYEQFVQVTTEVENQNKDDRLSRSPVLFQIDEDEFSSPESDIMIPEVEKCIATVSEDLQKVEEEVQQAPLQNEIRSSSPLTEEPKPKKPQKRKLIPTLDMDNSEPIVVSGITQVEFFKHNRKQRRSSVSGIFGSHINRLTPKSSSEPDMRKIGKSVKDRPRVSDDMSNLWKLRKAGRKLGSPPLPSLVCTSLHQEDLELVTAVVDSLGGFKIDNKVGPLTTHVIAGGPRRTLNMLFAIARGLWVLRHDWVLYSLEAGYWVDEEKFEMTDFSPVVMKSRIERQNFGPAFQPDLFSGVGSVFVTKDCSPPKEDVEELIRLCGGHVVTAARGAAIVVGGQRRNSEVTYVTAQWVLDSISSGALQAFDKYIVSQVPS